MLILNTMMSFKTAPWIQFRCYAVSIRNFDVEFGIYGKILWSPIIKHCWGAEICNKPLRRNPWIIGECRGIKKQMFTCRLLLFFFLIGWYLNE
jgi:hypothetical protein